MKVIVKSLLKQPDVVFLLKSDEFKNIHSQLIDL